MRNVPAIGLVLCLAASGCGSRPEPGGLGGGGAPAPQPRRPSPRTALPDPPPVAAQPTPPDPDPAPAAGTAPDVRVIGTPSERLVAISVTNASDAPVQLAKAVVVEMAHGARWSVVSGVAEITLRSDCQTPAPACITLVQGSTLEPPAWLGTVGDAQCICTRCGPAPSGRYRFVIRTCAGARIEGEPFELTR